MAAYVVCCFFEHQRSTSPSLLIYAATLNAMFARLSNAPLSMLTELPPLSDGLLALIGISHSGYLAIKALPASQHAPASTS